MLPIGRGGHLHRQQMARQNALSIVGLLWREWKLVVVDLDCLHLYQWHKTAMQTANYGVVWCIDHSSILGRYEWHR